MIKVICLIIVSLTILDTVQMLTERGGNCA